MVVWLASFPRSGNTFLRIVLRRLHGVQSSVAYDTDGVAERLGPELVGFKQRPTDDHKMRASSAPHFIKTHRQRDERIHDTDHMICLVRDGRDALVSWARLQSEDRPDTFETRLGEMIACSDLRGTGSWGANVLSWLQPAAPKRIVAKFEDLIAAPERTVARIVDDLTLDLPLVERAAIPSFADLVRRDGGFFRKGRVDGWRDEMPAQLLDLFWSRPENQAAMKLLGYA